MKSPLSTPANASLSTRWFTVDWMLWILLALAIGRLWLMTLPSSFWVDETVTAFVVEEGSGHPSFAVAPQVTKSIYYLLPEAVQRMAGLSEIGYRTPSILIMGITLFLVARLASRLIAPEAGWFAVFACLALRGINYEAADARPYALGMCVTAAALLFLVNWLDSGSALQAAGFIVFAALVWRVHLAFWPIYLVFAVYAVVRRGLRQTKVEWWKILAAFAILGLALIPVALEALSLLKEASSHVIVDPPKWKELRIELKLGLLCVGAGAALIGWWFEWRSDAPPPSASAIVLIAGWWLIHPVLIFLFSRWTGNSLFVQRYLSVALPGAVLAATLLPVWLIPRGRWKPLAAIFGLGVLIFFGQWNKLWPPHHNSGWREATLKISRLASSPDTPVICPSPFIEAKTPVWQPDYKLPGFLYAHLTIYPFKGRPYLLPFEPSYQAQAYAESLVRQNLAGRGQFFIYGGDRNVRYWTNWFDHESELANWTHQRLGPFGDVEVVMFERK